MSQESKAMDAGHHPLRHVTAEESPWPGMLTRGDDSALLLLVDANVFGESAGWNADPAGHILAPIDVVRRPAGHEVVLPACTERLDALLARRRERRLPLSEGERVTVAVSLIRGLREANSIAPGVAGAWWLTSEGRPVLALHGGEGTDATPAATARLLAAVSAGAGVALEPALARAAARAEEPRALAREADELEAAVFACAAPEPLATAGAVAFEGHRTLSRAVDDEALETPIEPGEGWLGRIVPLVDADLAETASRALTSVWRRLHGMRDAETSRPAGGRKRGPMLFAGAAAAAVVCIGLVWPGGADGPAQAGARPEPTRTTVPTPVQSPQSPTSTPAPSPAATRPARTESELVASAVDQLLTERSRCGDDESCLRDVQEDPKRRFAEGAASLPRDQRRVVLLDSFGGAAVAKVTSANMNAPAAEAAGAQLVVVVRDGDHWLIRDVYGAVKP